MNLAEKESLILRLRQQARIMPSERESALRMISSLNGEPVKPFKTRLKKRWKNGNQY
jgi:uncharacterized membrane protein YgcG